MQIMVENPSETVKRRSLGSINDATKDKLEKPFTLPTISYKLRQEMIAQRNNDRKRKAYDDTNVQNGTFL
uniref:Uncharacterized protein n=1 Tax=Panagrolaimus davidi TaxID=227884 RepID=A0A914PY98_9BILA